jgi:hypothetical protein
MREIRLSGSMSGNRKQSQVKPDCGGAAKAQPLATGRLKPLRLFSTPHIWGLRPRQTLVGSKLTDGKVNLLYSFDNGLCRGAFASFQELGNIHNQSCSRTCARILSTGNSTRTQLVSIFVEYAERNPRRLADAFAILALNQACTCRSQ